MDPYQRSRPDEPEPVHVERDTDKAKSFEIERRINKTITARGELNIWYDGRDTDPNTTNGGGIPELQNALDLVSDYENSMENFTSLPGLIARKANQKSKTTITSLSSSTTPPDHTRSTVDPSNPVQKSSTITSNAVTHIHSVSLRRSSRKGRGKDITRAR
jgi:hypothetical protein